MGVDNQGTFIKIVFKENNMFELYIKRLQDIDYIKIEDIGFIYTKFGDAIQEVVKPENIEVIRSVIDRFIS